MTKTIILDGGMGRELSARGAPFQQPEWSALALYESPEHVQAVHEDFIRAGAEVITTNSYAVVPFHIGDARFNADAERLAKLSGELAKNAIKATGKSDVRVAGCLPPLFGSYRPDLFDAAEAPRIVKPLIDGLADYADLWLLETQSSIVEVQTVLDLLPDDGKPVWVAFTVEDEDVKAEPTIRSGERVADAVTALLDSGVEAILFNCSQPEIIDDGIKVAHEILQEKQSSIQLGAYANAFVAEGNQGDANEQVSAMRDDLDTEAYLNKAKGWAENGATLIGGCCGIGPKYIQRLANYFL